MSDPNPDPSITFLFPIETMVPQSSSPINLHYTVTLDLPTSIIFCFTIILFFIFLFHILNGFLQWFFNVRHSNHDLELGEGGSSTPGAVYRNNMWLVGVLERLVSRFEERRLQLQRVKGLEKLPPLVCFGDVKMRVSSSSNECVICLEEFMNGEFCQVLPDCHHVFHSNCIDVWLRKKLTCPVCRNCIMGRS